VLEAISAVDAAICDSSSLRSFLMLVVDTDIAVVEVARLSAIVVVAKATASDVGPMKDPADKLPLNTPVAAEIPYFSVALEALTLPLWPSSMMVALEAEFVIELRVTEMMPGMDIAEVPVFVEDWRS
jgi:hypothetical protein